MSDFIRFSTLQTRGIFSASCVHSVIVIRFIYELRIITGIDSEWGSCLQADKEKRREKSLAKTLNLISKPPLFPPRCLLRFFTLWHFLFLSPKLSLSPAVPNQFCFLAILSRFLPLPLVSYYPVLPSRAPPHLLLLLSLPPKPVSACMWWV